MLKISKVYFCPTPGLGTVYKAFKALELDSVMDDTGRRIFSFDEVKRLDGYFENNPIKPKARKPFVDGNRSNIISGNEIDAYLAGLGSGKINGDSFYITPHELAKYLEISVRPAYRHIEKGHFGGIVRQGRNIFVTLSGVKDFHKNYQRMNMVWRRVK